MQQITIIGLGLIGGSIGLALRRWSSQNGNSLKIVGYDSDMQKQNTAKSMGAIDGSSWNLGDAIADADVVILATPVGAMKSVFEDIGPSLKFNAVVTDTGSTKADVMEWATVLPSHVSFIGGHPMAGKHESLEAADADLFQGATWVLTPSATASESAIRNVLGLVAATDAEAFFTEPHEHDAYVGGISHLPFVVAAALVQTATTDQSWRDMRSLASTGFRDTTRLALGSPEMHRDIALSNKASVTRWINEMIETLGDFRSMLNGEDEEEVHKAIGSFFEEAQDNRARAESKYQRSSERESEAVTQARSSGFGDNMGRMLFGGLMKKKPEDSAKKR